jgi:hypothetical protein
MRERVSRVRRPPVGAFAVELVHRVSRRSGSALARELRSSRSWTVPPWVITGGLAAAPMFSLIHSAARREDSPVPVLSRQTVTVMPPSPVRKAVSLTKPGTPPIRSSTSSFLCSSWSKSSEAPCPA